MSRTDKTKPMWVRIAEHHPIEEHDHRDGVCDLPETPWSAEAQSWRRNCHWHYSDILGHCCLLAGGRGHYDWGPSRHTQTQDLMRERPWPSRRKDTVTWCRGKKGRPHVQEIRYSSFASAWLATSRTPCRESPWRSDGWLCMHELGCSACGKILRTSLPLTDCPTWVERHSDS